MDNAEREIAFARCYGYWAAARNFRRFRTADQDAKHDRRFTVRLRRLLGINA